MPKSLLALALFMAISINPVELNKATLSPSITED